MEHKLTITLPTEIFAVIEEAARRAGRTPEDEIALLVERNAPRRSQIGKSSFDPLERHFGTWDSGDPDSANNERIDADLAKEYGSTHEDE
jgi:hypothetical protein